MKIGVFDSGYGGLTILQEIRKTLPEYDYIYLGDNARAPYGTRSFEVIYRYTLEAVQHLLAAGCELIILACNTASAKALRSIQQNDLPAVWAADGNEHRRVLGVIRPTVEAVAGQHIGILATQGTVDSESYIAELRKINEQVIVTQQACPMWVPMIENNEIDNGAMDYFVDKYIRELMAQDPQIDTVLLGCTHYPIIQAKIQQALGPGIRTIAQGSLVAQSLRDYLRRHTEIADTLSTGGSCEYRTTENARKFDKTASIFLGEEVRATQVEIAG